MQVHHQFCMQNLLWGLYFAPSCFGPGKGSVLNLKGQVELEASIMTSKGLGCGACVLVTRVKNPIKLARIVMEETPHILLSGRCMYNIIIMESTPTFSRLICGKNDMASQI